MSNNYAKDTPAETSERSAEYRPEYGPNYGHAPDPDVKLLPSNAEQLTKIRDDLSRIRERFRAAVEM